MDNTFTLRETLEDVRGTYGVSGWFLPKSLWAYERAAYPTHRRHGMEREYVNRSCVNSQPAERKRPNLQAVARAMRTSERLPVDIIPQEEKKIHVESN